MAKQVNSRVPRRIVHIGYALLFPVALWLAFGHFVLPDDLADKLLLLDAGQTAVDQGVRLRGQAYWPYWLHLAPTMFWVVFGPVQFSNKIRARWPGFHRWSGRIYALCGATIATTAVALAWIAPMQRLYPWTESAIVTMGSAISLTSIVAAIRAARARRFKEHREWMIRHVANGYIVVLTHALHPLWRAVTGRHDPLATDFVLVILLAFWVITPTAEWWLYTQRPKKRGKEAPLKARPHQAAAASENAA